MCDCSFLLLAMLMNEHIFLPCIKKVHLWTRRNEAKWRFPSRTWCLSIDRIWTKWWSIVIIVEILAVYFENIVVATSTVALVRSGAFGTPLTSSYSTLLHYEGDMGSFWNRTQGWSTRKSWSISKYGVRPFVRQSVHVSSCKVTTQWYIGPETLVFKFFTPL